MSELRVIKKYPNRRLYDTVESRYITLDDVRKLVLNRVEFCVVDKRSQQDITRPVLLQVISDQEQRNGTILSQDFLAELVRSHDAGLEGVLSSYLEQSLRLFLSQTPPSGDSAAAASQLAHQNYQRWHSAQEEIFRTLMKAASAA
ncbi:MAG TPA: polyhydroxyalkanoate synthesis repressor PhaR [Steroidobacteraceae bacterium]|jgi:polyhydroxyalkanoate synthesis repressor PhaR